LSLGAVGSQLPISGAFLLPGETGAVEVLGEHHRDRLVVIVLAHDDARHPP